MVNAKAPHYRNRSIAVGYPEPAFVCAEVGFGLLLPLPPLYQAGGVVSWQADVTAAGRGADSAPDGPGEEGLRVE